MVLSPDEVIRIFKETGALLEGHFQLTSGLHSGTYFQCALVFQYPWYAEKLCGTLIEQIENRDIDLVVSPAVGGIVVGQEIGRLLGIRSVFTERREGKMDLRRGFSIAKDEKVLVAEDVTTTGGSVQEVIELIRKQHANVSGVAAIVDRSDGQVDFSVPYTSLLRMDVVNYKPEVCPLCQSGNKPLKPGSRSLIK